MSTMYTANVKVIGGRDGSAQSDDNNLNVKLARPGSNKTGATNPEQLFAAGYAACFGSALAHIAKEQGKDASTAEINASVDLNKDDSGFSLGVTLNVSLPGLDAQTAQKLVQAAHQMCPYSKATRGNIEVTLTVNDQPLANAA